jgi:hypothetical protein
MSFLWYVLMLGWFGAETHAPLIEPDGQISLSAVAEHRLTLAMIPLFLIIFWRLRSLRRQLNRTVVASVLSVAEELGMTLVGSPELLRRPEPSAAGSEPAAATAAVLKPAPVPPVPLVLPVPPPAVPVQL